MYDGVIIHKLKEAKEQFSSREVPAQIIPGVTKLSELVFSKGDFQLRYYEPGSVDMQVPHDQEEIYFWNSRARSFYSELGAIEANEWIPYSIKC